MDAAEQVPPLRVGRYQLVDRLAVGGMAEVFLAVDRSGDADRLVVIKRILPHLAQDPEFAEAFAHEARIASRIHHPNVIRLFELGQASGLPFIAMEYLAGSTFKDLILASNSVGRALPVEAALSLLAQACAGAHAAHELLDPEGRLFGLVHRDITPHNLMVDDQGHVKLFDFGIAKASEGVDQTRTGMLKGKIAYMSPEQCRQERLDRRSDVFSLGVVGYQLLTGKKPFQGPSELATMQAIISCRYPPIGDCRPEVSEEVSAAIERAMAPTPDQRFQDADGLRRALVDSGEVGERPGGFVRSLLGEIHDRRRKAIDDALSRTLDLSRPSSVESRTPSLENCSSAESIDRPSPLRPAAPPRRRDGALSAATLRAAGIGVALSAIGAAVAFVGGRGPPVEPPPIEVTLADPELAPLEPVLAYLEGALQREVSIQPSAGAEDAADALLSGRTGYAVLPAGAPIRSGLEILAIEIVERSPRGAIVAGPSADPSTTRALREALLAFEPERNGGEPLGEDRPQITGFVDPAADLGKIHER